MKQQSEFSFEQKQECTGYDLFRYCHALARQCKRRFPEQPLLPSGARIFYYTRRLLLAKGFLPEVNPNKAILTEPVVERFLQEAPLVVGWLVSEFPRAIGVRVALELTWIPTDLAGSNGDIQLIWERLEETCWSVTNQEHRGGYFR